MSGQGVALPAIFVDCSSSGVSESSTIRVALSARNVDFLAAPVSGNGKCVKAGKLSSVVSGPKTAFDKVRPLIEAYARRGVSYVGEGELARELDVPMPVTAATREVAQVHLGAAQLQPDPVAYLQKDFAALFEAMALGAGIKLESESIEVPSGLEAWASRDWRSALMTRLALTTVSLSRSPRHWLRLGGRAKN